MFSCFICCHSVLISSIVVYVRDVSNAMNILCGCLMFALPIMYLAEQRSTPAMELFWSVNPLYYYIETIHDAFYYCVVPDLFQLLICFILAPIVFTGGLFVFKKLEKGFAEQL